MIRRATEADVPGIVRVINEAFEVEREFRKGDRTSAAEIGALLARDVFLVTEQDGRVDAAVHVRVTEYLPAQLPGVVASADVRLGLGSHASVAVGVAKLGLAGHSIVEAGGSAEIAGAAVSVTFTV